MARPAINLPVVGSTLAQAAAEHAEDCLKGTPWENLGHRIPVGASVHEMLTAAQLDWNVLRGETYVRVKTSDGEEHRIINPKSFALVRESDLAILSPHVGPYYKVIQNTDAFTVFDEFVKAGQMTMETAGSFGNGQHIWGLAKTGHGFELASGERIESYFLLFQSHLYGYALKAMWTPIRFPGGYSLVQNINKKGLGGKKTFSMSHARHFNAERIQEIKEVIGVAARSMAEFRGKAEFLEKMRISTADAIHYLIQVFDKELPGRCAVSGDSVPLTFDDVANCRRANRNLKKIAALLKEDHYLDGRGTAWGCWSTVNRAFDHEMGHRDNTRLESIWLGKNKDAKLKAFDLANALASAKGK
jgi:phage/plasmid-like protein (TIGR03299 family)